VPQEKMHQTKGGKPSRAKLHLRITDRKKKNYRRFGDSRGERRDQSPKGSVGRKQNFYPRLNNREINKGSKQYRTMGKRANRQRGPNEASMPT